MLNGQRAKSYNDSFVSFKGDKRNTTLDYK